MLAYKITTSFNVNCIGQSKLLFISGQYNARWMNKIKTFPDLGSSYATAAVPIGTYLAVPRQQMKGLSLM
jgi:hypothetical protein